MQAKTAICILNFHGIGKPRRLLDPGEEPYWISEDFFHKIMARVAHGKTPHPVHITFDDGNASDYDIALPVLKSFGLTATFFVLTGRLDKPGSLSRKQVEYLTQEGIEIGSHGHDHVDWRSLDEAGKAREYIKARKIIANVTGKDVNRAGIPFGAYDARVIADLKRNGYMAAFSSDRGFARASSFLQERTSITTSMTMRTIEDILHDSFSLAQKARRSVGRLKRRFV